MIYYSEALFLIKDLINMVIYLIREDTISWSNMGRVWWRRQCLMHMPAIFII